MGNLRAGGAGKTPVVMAIARLLAARGQRPAILTRGYARRVTSDGVTVVSDGTRVLARLDAAGDEALMLARGLDGIPVLVGADRYLSGCLAERRLGATVHVLDDGFQHLALAREVDLLVVDEDDLTDRLLPAGRLREPVQAASVADALLTASPQGAAVDRLRTELGVATVFRLSRTLGPPRPLGSDGGQTGVRPPSDPPCAAFAVAAIARPERFFTDLAAAGWPLTGTRTFRDHHAFTAADAGRIRRAARDSGAQVVLTTEKDAVRIERFATGDPPIAAVPLQVVIEPGFADWLVDRIARTGSGGAELQDARR